MAEWPGRSPTLVEDQVTYPLVTSLLGTPNVEEVRGQSMFGMSFVYVVFEEGTDAYWARSRVLEYLNTVQSRLPEGATTRLGPDASGVGWVFQYALVDESGKRDSGELRTLHDFSIRYALASVEGVAEIAELVSPAAGPVRLLVDPRCARVIAALEGYRRGADGAPVKDGVHDHVVDALRYAVAGHGRAAGGLVVRYY